MVLWVLLIYLSDLKLVELLEQSLNYIRQIKGGAELKTNRIKYILGPGLFSRSAHEIPFYPSTFAAPLVGN